MNDEQKSGYERDMDAQKEAEDAFWEERAKRRAADGGPAFPQGDWPGMTIRDVFASMALLGLVQRHPADARVPVEKVAYAIADRMLIEREVKKP